MESGRQEAGPATASARPGDRGLSGRHSGALPVGRRWPQRGCSGGLPVGSLHGSCGVSGARLPDAPSLPAGAASRLPELLGVGVPTFVVQGELDRFGSPADLPEHVDVAVIPEADHSFRVPRRAVLSQEDTYALIVEAVVEWVTARVA